MPREVTDAAGITWTCIQVFAGLGKDAEKVEASRVEGTAHRVHVVCTPSGGAKSVRLELAEDWEKALADEQLLSALEAQRAREG